MSETLLVKAILSALHLHGLWCWRVNAGVTVLGGGRSRRVIRGAPAGTPDILGVLPGGRGRLFGLEVKTARGRLEESQVAWHELATSKGVRVAVVRSAHEALDIVTRWALEEAA